MENIDADAGAWLMRYSLTFQLQDTPATPLVQPLAPPVPSPESGLDKWLQALEEINKSAADAALRLAQQYPWLALFLVILLLYLSTRKVGSMSPLEALLTGVFRVVRYLSEGFRDVFNWAASNLLKSAASIHRFYGETFRANMAFEAPLVLFFTLIAVGVIFVNFSLIYRPLQGWFGTALITTPAGSIPQSLLYAMLLILMELMIGYGLVQAMLRQRREESQSWTGLAMSPLVVLAALCLAVLGGIEAYLAIRREFLIEQAQHTQDYLQSLDSGRPLAAVEDFVVGLPAYVQAMLGFIFPFVLAFTSTYIERFFAILAYVLAVLPAIVFSLVERVFRVITQILDWAIDALTALVDLVRSFLAIFFWPFEQIAKRVGSSGESL